MDIHITDCGIRRSDIVTKIEDKYAYTSEANK